MILAPKSFISASYFDSICSGNKMKNGSILKNFYFANQWDFWEILSNFEEFWKRLDKLRPNLIKYLRIAQRDNLRVFLPFIFSVKSILGTSSLKNCHFDNLRIFLLFRFSVKSFLGKFRVSKIVILNVLEALFH